MLNLKENTTYKAVIVALVVIIGVLVFMLVQSIGNITTSSLYSKDEYHIVFMDNSLFYFCKLSDFDGEFIACNEPYYLVRKQVEENGQRVEKILIRKPGEEEVYQPDGPIYLKKDKISYISKVGDNSAVIDFINGKTQ